MSDIIPALARPGESPPSPGRFASCKPPSAAPAAGRQTRMTPSVSLAARKGAGGRGGAGAVPGRGEGALGTGHILLTHGANKRPRDLSLASKGVVTQSRREAQRMTGNAPIGCGVMRRSRAGDALPREEMGAGVACAERPRASPGREAAVPRRRRQIHVEIREQVSPPAPAGRRWRGGSKRGKDLRGFDSLRVSMKDSDGRTAKFSLACAFSESDVGGFRATG